VVRATGTEIKLKHLHSFSATSFSILSSSTYGGFDDYDSEFNKVVVAGFTNSLGNLELNNSKGFFFTLNSEK